VVSDGVTKEEMALCGCEHAPAESIQQVIDDLLRENPEARIGALSNGAETLLYE